jgi:hypothetical protein
MAAAPNSPLAALLATITADDADTDGKDQKSILGVDAYSSENVNRAKPALVWLLSCDALSRDVSA